MNYTLKKIFIFAAKIILHGVLWIIALFIGLLIIAIARPSEEEILLGGLELLALMIFSCTSSWFLGRKIRNLFAPKSYSLTSTLAEPVLPPETDIMVSAPVVLPIEPLYISSTESPYIPSPLERIDTMDGHTFEYWCADFLRDNGFINVSVTRGSGDQGVDVLAEKDGIRYAIQCKCYSHDLGNTPVQEVNAGRVIYRCHIGAVMTNRYFTKGAKDAADATGVLLWDRDWIKAHLKESQTDEKHSSQDPLLWAALDLVHRENCASAPLIRDGLGIGYARAARILDSLEEMGYVGPFRGSIPREILK